MEEEGAPVYEIGQSGIRRRFEGPGKKSAVVTEDETSDSQKKKGRGWSLPSPTIPCARH